MSKKIASWFIETSYTKLVSIIFAILSGFMLGLLQALGRTSDLIEQKALTAIMTIFLLGISYAASNGLKNSAFRNKY